MSFDVSEKGYFGEFGGAYIPEMLVPNISELQGSYKKIIEEPEFKESLNHLLKNYAGRPTPLYYAQRLSERYGYKIYLKREDLAHTGSHKINNTLGQVLLAKRLGKTRIIAETGAGQHGVATASVCALMNIPCVVFMGEVDIARQALNVARMKMLGAEVRSVTSGSKTLKDATNEALRDWIKNPRDTHYVIGSVVGPHPFPDMVAHFQSVISMELKGQFQSLARVDLPDAVLACVGGGSNAIGGFYHFLKESAVKLYGAEAAGCGLDSGKSAATIALGRSGILHGSKTLFMQNADGQVEEAHSISAGLDYPGVGPQHAELSVSKRVQYIPVTDAAALKAANLLSRSEGIIPALESAHAFALLDIVKFNTNTNLVVILSGRGDKDMGTYSDTQKSFTE